MEKRMKSILLYLEEDIYDWVRDYARKQGTNMSFVIGEMVRKSVLELQGNKSRQQS